jgi:hypothetical protein
VHYTGRTGIETFTYRQGFAKAVPGGKREEAFGNFKRWHIPVALLNTNEYTNQSTQRYIHEE